MIPPGKVQVPGFSNDDQYLEVVAKGAKGLGITISPDRLSLIVSNGLIRDAPLPSGVPWTLGNYVKEFGGVQARGKRTFGIFMPYDVDDEEAGIYSSANEQVKIKVLVPCYCENAPIATTKEALHEQLQQFCYQ